MEQKEKSPLEQLIVWAETASKQSIIDKAHELMKIERMEVKSQRLVELMQVLEMIEYLLQNGNTITPDSFVIRTAVRLAIGMDALNNEKEDLSESVAKILNASNCVEKAIEFSNSHEDNEGAYLAYLAGAKYMADFIEYEKNKKTK